MTSGDDSSSLWFLLTFTFGHMKARLWSLYLFREGIKILGGFRGAEWDVQTVVCFGRFWVLSRGVT